MTELRTRAREIVEDPETNPDPVTPLVIRPSVAHGTLPRLRYGREYAFRIWATDLAGNSRPHHLGGPVGQGRVQALRQVWPGALERSLR